MRPAPGTQTQHMVPNVFVALLGVLGIRYIYSETQWCGIAHFCYQSQNIFRVHLDRINL